MSSLSQPRQWRVSPVAGEGGNTFLCGRQHAPLLPAQRESLSYGSLECCLRCEGLGFSPLLQWT